MISLLLINTNMYGADKKEMEDFPTSESFSQYYEESDWPIIEKYGKKLSPDLFLKAKEGETKAIFELIKISSNVATPPIVPLYWCNKIVQKGDVSPKVKESARVTFELIVAKTRFRMIEVQEEMWKEEMRVIEDVLK